MRDGVLLGIEEGEEVPIVGVTDGSAEGMLLGVFEGGLPRSLGAADGGAELPALGDKDGDADSVGDSELLTLGSIVGSMLGNALGSSVTVTCDKHSSESSSPPEQSTRHCRLESKKQP